MSLGELSISAESIVNTLYVFLGVVIGCIGFFTLTRLRLSTSSKNKAHEKNLNLDSQIKELELEELKRKSSRNLEDVSKSIQLQKRLTEDIGKFNDKTKEFYLAVNDISERFQKKRALDKYREKAVIAASESVNLFSNYMAQAKHFYPQYQKENREDYLYGELSQFLKFVSEAVAIMNNEEIISRCSTYKEPMSFTDPTFIEIRMMVREVTGDFSKEELKGLYDKFSSDEVMKDGVNLDYIFSSERFLS